MLKQHVIENIDNAVNNGWIKVYYQPVIRTLTGNLCGFESLARWEDPEFGFLAPFQFVEALEESELIYKLDIYMVEKVCSDIHDRLVNGLDAVPVSINFSRLDFLTCDMLEVVESAVSRYDIPRDYLHIEITENMMITDGDFMQGVIEGFREHGYAVWMDDFGSGYSSLNLLKDFNIDLMKMDMTFLSSMNTKSKAIVKALITMAKDIGIMTLTEGVETEEEVEFLSEIGCGKMQGFYYGKPLPLEEAFANMEAKGIAIEGRKWQHFYDTAEFHVRSTDIPLELVLDDGKTLKTLFMNDVFKLQIFDDLPDLEETDRRLYYPGSPLFTKLREFAVTAERSKKPEVFYFTTKGNYFCIKGREVAECDGYHILKASISNLSMDESAAKREEFDFRLRELNHLFAVVLLFNTDEQRVTPLIGKFKFFKGPEKMEMHKSSEMMANAVVHPHDRQRYINFMDSSTFADRVENSPAGFVEEAFRFKSETGDYRWVTATVMMMPGSDGKQFLYCVKPFSVNSAKTLLDHGSAVSSLLKPDEYSLLWYNILWNSSIKFFWKDKDLRYLGASKAFLDYFKLDSVEEIIGKRGEDMNWHLNSESYHKEENDIVKKGKISSMAVCQCMIDGVVHNTMTSKLPVYLSGEIVGVMGYVIDLDEARKNLGFDADSSKTDPVTGLGNVFGFIESVVDYSKQYHSLNKDYGLILLKNVNHKRILEDYGAHVTDGVLQSIGDLVSDYIGETGMISRTKDSFFTVLTHCSSRQEMTDKAEELKNRIESITSVDGKGVTIRIAYTVRIRSDAGMTDEEMYVSALDELRKV